MSIITQITQNDVFVMRLKRSDAGLNFNRVKWTNMWV